MQHKFEKLNYYDQIATIALTNCKKNKNISQDNNLKLLKKKYHQNIEKRLKELYA